MNAYLSTKKLVLSGLLIALGVTLSQFYLPFGVSKVFPVQHLVNVISAVTLGPLYAVLNAFIISLLRYSFGMGSLLAFPGSMIGALLAGIVFHIFNNKYMAALGELIGTGFLGALICIPIANSLMGASYGALFFIPSFFISSLTGTVIALVVLKLVPNTFLFNAPWKKNLNNH